MKVGYVVSKKWPEMVIKWLFGVVIFQFFSYKIEKTGNDKNCVLCYSFWSTMDLDKLRTSK